MTTGRTRASILVAAIVMVALTTSSAHAALSSLQKKCVQTIAKGAQGFVKGKLKVMQKCKNAGLKDGSCTSPAPADVLKLETKLDLTIDKGCAEANNPASMAALGFPGPCSDVTPMTPFTLSDAKACIKTTHTAIIDQMFALQYDATVTGPLVNPADLKCAVEVGKQAAAFELCLLKNVQKCRTDILKDKPVGVPPDLCATAHLKTKTAIDKCKTKTAAKIAAKCNAGQITSLKVCTPDQTDAAAAATCLIDGHSVITDGTEITVPPDLIDYEYATRGGLCGDNIVNNLNEECDGTSDSACPGQCGTPEIPDGFFACLCKTKNRMVIAEHADADTDNGYLGLSVDGDVVEGGGFILDLYDCDGMTGICNAGPSCSLAPHSPCAVPDSAASGTTGDSVCAGLGQGTCRKERTANGPHCYLDIQKKCSISNAGTSAVPCNAPGDYCMTTFHGAPVAAAAGGISVCNVSTFMEDVVGTVNLNTGESSLKVRQRAKTFNSIVQPLPCPVCGGFCGLNRNKQCSVDGDCGVQGPCITAAVCSNGVRKDKKCRRTAPFGGPITFFGTPSVDCPPDTQPYTDGNGLDINANPRTTGTSTLLPTVPCTGLGLNDNRCVGGSSEGRLCTVASECPGGTCNPQCFCVNQVRPNGCADACVGGTNDMAGCSEDAECPGGGFCHPADCRVNPSDLDSNQEGLCTAGPIDKFCSITTWHSCSVDAHCNPPPAGVCTDCAGGETCDAKLRQCFVNSGIVRTGTPGYPDRETAATYCVPANNTAINTTAGFPGPGALIQREVVTVVP